MVDSITYDLSAFSGIVALYFEIGIGDCVEITFYYLRVDPGLRFHGLIKSRDQLSVDTQRVTLVQGTALPVDMGKPFCTWAHSSFHPSIP
jgi:hypothetical protein